MNPKVKQFNSRVGYEEFLDIPLTFAQP